MLKRVVGMLMLALITSATAAQSSPEAEFGLKFDAHGIVSLKRIADKYDTDYIADGATLGHLIIHYKMGENDWREFSTRDPKNKLVKLHDDDSSRVTDQLSVVYNPQDWRKKEYYADLELTERFRAERDALYWTIFIRNPTHKPIVLGDIYLPLPFNSSMRWDKEITYHERVVRHEYISGNGSFVYWMRPTGEGPYLVMTPVSKCPLFEPTRSEMNFAVGRLEYSDRGGLYILSGRRGERDRAQGGTWRQPETMHTLAPTNSQRDGITFAFKFRWAKDYDGVRSILYDEGVPDVHVVPGMTVPVGTEAMISIRSRDPIHTFEPEFPSSTDIRAGETSAKDTSIYKVKFSRLGENKLTLHYGKDLYSVLEFFVTEPVATLIKKRAEFLVTHQQHRDPSKWYDGLFSEWDMKEKVLRSPDDTGGLADYILASDDPALCKPAFLAAKNAVYPDAKEIAALEYYLKNFVWGKLQMTTEEKYPYAVYGIDNWKINRNSKPEDRYGWTNHVWRTYDYPHVVMLYWNMYLIAKHYPELVHYLTADQYLERAYGTALAFYTYPWQMAHWSANELGNYNELVIAKIINELDRTGKHDLATTLRRKWDEKVEYFINDKPDLFYSEYPFDPTAFESTGAFAHYALQQLNVTASTLKVTKADAERFLHEQLACNMATRGVLATNYWQLGVEGNMRYMSQMGGWSILDYGLYFAKDPWPYLRLGYASLLSSWALMNTGTPESNYGYWYPGKENDGGAGSAYVPQAHGSNWFGKSQPRGAWQYSGEIDLGFGAALRTAAVIVVDDPIFGRFAYGGELKRHGNQNKVIPEDGVRRQFHIVEAQRKIHIELEQDGFAAQAPIIFDKDLREISFQLENREPEHKAHLAELRASGLDAAYVVIIDGTARGTLAAGTSNTTVEVPISGGSASVVLRRATTTKSALADKLAQP